MLQIEHYVELDIGHLASFFFELVCNENLSLHISGVVRHMLDDRRWTFSRVSLWDHLVTNSPPISMNLAMLLASGMSRVGQTVTNTLKFSPKT